MRPGPFPYRRSQRRLGDVKLHQTTDEAGAVSDRRSQRRLGDVKLHQTTDEAGAVSDDRLLIGGLNDA